MEPNSEPANLFTARYEEEVRRNAPLATRLRPRNLDEVVGQEHLLGPEAPLRKSVEAGDCGSMIFFGPPGSGKTTVARLVASVLGAEFAELSAVDSGVADVRRVIGEARRRREEGARRTVLFLDEIHRFSKAQQDALLHPVEDGLVVLIGATTENPFFSVITPLLSRCELHRFHLLEDSDLRRLVERALADPERGVSGGVEVDTEARDALARTGRGDARRSLNLLERAVGLAESRGQAKIDREVLEDAAGELTVPYDRDGDVHYDVASALIKSLRGSDPDAALYYVAVMLAGGEDPLFIARRLVIFASEDVGNADPRALEIAVSVSRAVEFVGLPEARINLAQGVTYLATAPKSNASYKGIEEASHAVREAGPQPPPPHLRDTHYRGARELGHGEGYVYPHSHGGYTAQEHLPEALAGTEFYRPTEEGEEARIREFLEHMRRLRREGGETE